MACKALFKGLRVVAQPVRVYFPMSQEEFDALRERNVVRPVDGHGLTPHVGLPGIAARFASATGILLAAKCPADFRAAGPDVHVGNAAVASGVAQEPLG